MSDISEGLVITETPAPGIIRLVLNRPDTFNALSSEMLSALEQALTSAGQTSSCRVIVLASRGKAFCAGHDLREMRAHPDENFYLNLFAQCSRLMAPYRRSAQSEVVQRR